CGLPTMIMAAPRYSLLTPRLPGSFDEKLRHRIGIEGRAVVGGMEIAEEEPAVQLRLALRGQRHELAHVESGEIGAVLHPLAVEERLEPRLHGDDGELGDRGEKLGHQAVPFGNGPAGELLEHGRVQKQSIWPDGEEGADGCGALADAGRPRPELERRI